MALKVLSVAAAAMFALAPVATAAQQREPIGNDTPGQVRNLAISTCQTYQEFGYSSYDQCFNDIVSMYNFPGGGDPSGEAFCAAFTARTGNPCFT